MNIREFDIPSVKLAVPKRFEDDRGVFQEIWSDRLFRRDVSDTAFVQDNQSVSKNKGTVHGLISKSDRMNRASWFGLCEDRFLT
jgi:dTDP-4-dehydrorhamnose 3,5-epimerase